MRLRRKVKLYIYSLAWGSIILIIAIQITRWYLGITIESAWSNYGIAGKIFVVFFPCAFLMMIYFILFNPTLKQFDKFYSGLTDIEKQKIDAAIDEMIDKHKDFAVTDFAVISHQFIVIVAFKFENIKEIKYNPSISVVTIYGFDRPASFKIKEEDYQLLSKNIDLK